MFIDIHAHTTIYPVHMRPRAEKNIGTPDTLVRMYDDAGISRGVILPAVSPEPRAAVQSNEDILLAAQRYPDRLIPFCGIDPRLSRNSADTDLGFVINHYKGKGCRGIGEITANLSFDDPRVENLFDHAEKCELPLTFHVATREGGTYGLIDEIGLPRFEKQIEKHADLVFLCHSQAWWAHMSGDVSEESWGRYPEGPVAEGGRVPWLMRTYPNLYGDLSALSGSNALSRDPRFGYAFLTEFQDRLCFGTDVCAPMHTKTVGVTLADFLNEAVRKGKISQEVFDKIAYKNASRILDL